MKRDRCVTHVGALLAVWSLLCGLGCSRESEPTHARIQILASTERQRQWVLIKLGFSGPAAGKFEFETGDFDPQKEGQMLALLGGKIVVRVKGSKEWSGEHCRIRLDVLADRTFTLRVVDLTDVKITSRGQVYSNAATFERGEYDLVITGCMPSKQ